MIQDRLRGESPRAYRCMETPPTLDFTVRIYTKTGDNGETSLFGGGRVPKNHPRVAAYGDVDELNAVLGVALATEPLHFEEEVLGKVQQDLMAIAAQLATPKPDRVAPALAKAAFGPSMIASLETAIDRIDSHLPELTAFILPGGTAKAATLQWARTVCRRAERSVVELAAAEDIPEAICGYLNRLSDLLFVLGRLANQSADTPDREW